VQAGKFGASKIRRNLGKTCENLRKLPENTGKNGAQRGLV